MRKRVALERPFDFGRRPEHHVDVQPEALLDRRLEHSGRGLFFPEKSTLPLWMYVRTSSKPSDSASSRSSAIGSVRPPTLTPRSSPTVVGTSVLPPANTIVCPERIHGRKH